MTASNLPILDYAAPQAKSKFRIGTRSVLRTQRSADELCVVESLENHAEAIGAMVFSWLAMTPMIILACWATARIWTEPVLAIAAWILPLAAALTTCGVIQNTWGRTILIVTRDSITLRFVSPLRKVREHCWPTQQLRSAMVLRRASGSHEFNELELDFSLSAVHLFGGHPWRELTELERTIREIAGEAR
jgi:hypothetical protein